MSLPPELLSPEDREARAAELVQRIAREWVRFAIVDNALLLPLVGLAVLYYSDSISLRALVVGSVPIATAICAVTLYWVFVRIRPLQKQLVPVGSPEQLDRARGG